LFDLWLARRYAQLPRIAEEVVLAVQRQANRTTYELRIEPGFFKTGQPTGFGVRVDDDDGQGISRRLEWGGALTDPAVFPLAPLAPVK
ncbi:MAG: hypothetical protein GY773_32465, partial [Actinomycetia bacterium]|nr:hypothetical protein [Actinomycetes bacterium]